MPVYVVKGSSALIQTPLFPGPPVNEKHYFTALQKLLPLATFEQSTAHELVNGLINYWLSYFCRLLNNGVRQYAGVNVG